MVSKCADSLLAIPSNKLVGMLVKLEDVGVEDSECVLEVVVREEGVAEYLESR